MYIETLILLIYKIFHPCIQTLYYTVVVASYIFITSLLYKRNIKGKIKALFGTIKAYFDKIKKGKSEKYQGKDQGVVWYHQSLL